MRKIRFFFCDSNRNEIFTGVEKEYRSKRHGDYEWTKFHQYTASSDNHFKAQYTHKNGASIASCFISQNDFERFTGEKPLSKEEYESNERERQKAERNSMRTR